MLLFSLLGCLRWLYLAAFSGAFSFFDAPHRALYCLSHVCVVAFYLKTSNVTLMWTIKDQFSRHLAKQWELWEISKTQRSCWKMFETYDCFDVQCKTADGTPCYSCIKHWQTSMKATTPTVKWNTLRTYLAKNSWNMQPARTEKCTHDTDKVSQKVLRIDVNINTYFSVLNTRKQVFFYSRWCPPEAALSSVLASTRTSFGMQKQCQIKWLL